MFNWFKKKKFEDEITNISDDKKYKDRFNRYIQFVNTSRSKVETAQYISSVITEYLNFYEAVQSLESEHEVRDNTIIEEIYRRIEANLDLDSNLIVIDNIHKDDLKFYKDTKIKEAPLLVDIAQLPILLNPWKGSRVIDSLHGINENNVFDGIIHSYNIQNNYLYPMDIFVCQGANHSQFAAKFKNQGTTLVKQILNFSELYNYVYFDGEFYRFKNNDLEMYLEYSKEDLFYSGVVFELGRYILESNYHRFELTKHI